VGLQGVLGELIVVDNASVDGSVECVRSHFSDVKIIENKKNRGFARACNQGAEVAAGEYILLHNPDLQIDKDAIDKLVEVARQYPEAGAMAGRMRFPDGSFQATCRNLPTVGNLLFSRGSALSFLMRERHIYTLPDYTEVTEVPVVSGTLMLIRSDLFIAHGGFDARFFMYMEDTDLCYRLDQSGHKSYFVPTAGGIHLWGKGSRRGRLIRRWYHHWSVWKYFLKHFPNGFSLLILPMILGVNFILGALSPRPEGDTGT
jgi:hypothetical protein